MLCVLYHDLKNPTGLYFVHDVDLSFSHLTLSAACEMGKKVLIKLFLEVQKS